jgi:hypothetical protein
MQPPPPQGDPYELVPPGISNRELEGVLLAWENWQFFAGTAIDQGIADLYGSQGILA